VSDDSRSGLLGFLFIAGIGILIYGAGGINEAWYSVKYWVSPSIVHIGAQPKDCDFMSAPLGSKGCHYEADVAAYNTEGMLVGGDHAPRYEHDTKTGKPIYSNDNGKTWDWLQAPDVPDPAIKRVVVLWVKVKD